MTDVNLGFSEVVNIILSLFLGFQWLKDRSREKSIRHGLFAVREMVERSNSPSTPDILSSLDGNLATLGVRPPYTEKCTFFDRSKIKTSRECFSARAIPHTKERARS